MKAIAYLSLTFAASMGLIFVSPATAHPLTTQLGLAAASFGQTVTDGDAFPVTPPPAAARPNAGSTQAAPRSAGQDPFNRLPPIRNANAADASTGGRAGSNAPRNTNGRPLAGGRVVSHPAKDRASQLVFQAEQQMLRGELDSALRLTEQAQRLQVPNAAFGPRETRPWQLLMEIQRRQKGVMPVGNFVLPERAGSYPVQQGLYNPSTDPTSNMRAQNQTPTLAGPTQPAPAGRQLFEQGMTALQGQDRERALQLFRDAWQHQADLDPATRQQLKEKLSLLSSARELVPSGREPSPLEQVDTAQELLRQSLYQDFSKEEKVAEQQLRAEPFAALERMEKLRAKVGASELGPGAQKQLMVLIDRRVNQFRTYIDQHRAEIEQDDRNAAILASIDRDRTRKFETQNKIAQLVEEYNDLIEEQRFSEAEVRAKQVRALDPNSPIARTLLINSRLGSRIREQENIAERGEQGVYDALTSVGVAGIPFNDRNPIDFGPVDDWVALSTNRRMRGDMKRRQLSPAEIKIEAALKQTVQVKFTNRPLKEVLDTLGSMSNVNIYADPQGLGAEGVTSDEPVTINLTEPVSLKSALKLILEPLRLSYVVQHEVLRITSETSGDANVYTDVYNVADLVIPIPNFVPGYNVGLPAAIREAHRSLGYGSNTMGMSPMTIAPTDLQGNASINSSVLAQSNSFGLQPRGGSRPSQPLGYGTGSMGGAALADFDTLIELITSTIAPDTWDDVGGPGAIESFPTNLSLVISQTQDVHDQIADLLEQLRRLQDLQVTIEVRFITLRDDFFEQMGMDFDFDIDDNVQQLPFDDSGNSVTIGLDATGIPTADLDVSFNQGSFAASQPAFGGFDAASAASIGFAILSDIEAFFVLQAAQGDQRSNVLQAPKVTLFNGQQASVSDTSQRPFVTSLIPVVGDFAAAHQPVIVVLSEGTSLSVQAVVSSDRRFVRLTLVPFFSQIGDVEEFTFDGRVSTESGSNVVDADGNPTSTSNNTRTTTEGTTVQLPTFAFTTVSTTVSVPDGGTVLLGGIKRLREGRNEQGVPVLSKLPYINRLFKNVGIGRETQSLMLMVTPRIIIQEEEEEKLGIELAP